MPQEHYTTIDVFDDIDERECPKAIPLDDDDDEWDDDDCDDD